LRPLSVVVRTGCDFFAWFMIVFGVNIVIHGYMTPGGGFQGGAIIATFLAFLLVSYGGKKVLSWVNEKIYEFLFEELGLICFFVLALLGIGNSFFYNFLASPLGAERTGILSLISPAGTTVFMSIAVGIEVTGALSLVIIAMFRGIRQFSVPNLPEEEIGHDR